MVEISLINEAYHKYVPSQFFAFLQKESVTEVELGNQKQKELAILNFNINDFKDMAREDWVTSMFAVLIKDEVITNYRTALAKLREYGYSVEFDYNSRKFAKQLEKASKTANYAVILGQDELEQGYYTVKDLRNSQQEKKSFDELININK